MSVLMAVRCQHQVVIVGRTFGARSIDWLLDCRCIGAIVRLVDRRRIGMIIWLIDRMYISMIGCLGCRRNGIVVIGFIPQAVMYRNVPVSIRFIWY